MQVTSSWSEFAVASGQPELSPPAASKHNSKERHISAHLSHNRDRPRTPRTPGSNNKRSWVSTSPHGDKDEPNCGLTLQPETRQITQEQLINEVKGIYAGLVMVEKKCVEVDQQQAATANKLTNEQWQALLALHRTLLHEHYDFFLASQYPSSSPNLKRLATKYAMPARMWRHGIHSFLELLRHRLPHSLEHMLSFIYLAYSMIALLMDSVPSFEETWIECLGDLARYRMAIEEHDMRDREVWAGVARMWYGKAADKSPDVGRIQHHLAVLARPNIVQQLFYYSKALVSAHPFSNARESILLLFNPLLPDDETASQRYPLVESAFVKAAALQFSRGSIACYERLVQQCGALLDGHIAKSTVKFRGQGPEMASTLCASLFDFGDTESLLWRAFVGYDSHYNAMLENLKKSSGRSKVTAEREASAKVEQRRQYINSLDRNSSHPQAIRCTTDSANTDATFSGSNNAVLHACNLFYLTVEVALSRNGDKNVLPFAHVILAFLNSLAYVPDAMSFVEGQVPWESVVTFLNTMGRSGASEACYEGSTFPQSCGGTGPQLPEDFIMRGLIWAKHYFPRGWFEAQVVDADERTLELPSHTTPRMERCLWLGVQLATLGRWITYDAQTKRFAITRFASSLDSDRKSGVDDRSPTMSVEGEDTSMTDVTS